MNEELIKSMFLKARDQYEGAVRWALLAVIFSALFHLLTFSQYISLNKRMAEAQTISNDLGQLEGELSETTSNLEYCQLQMDDAFEQQVESTVRLLATDFEELSTAVNKIRTPSTSGISPLDPNSLLENGSQITIQQPQIGQSISRPVFQFDASLENEIRNAKSETELRQLLIPIIEEQIIQPRFRELNEFWKNNILTNLKDTIPQAMRALEDNRLLFPGDPKEFDELINQLDRTLNYVDSIVFVPPSSDPEWWDSVAGKRATLNEMRDAVISGFLDVSSVESFKEAQTQVQEAHEKQVVLLDEIHADIQELEEKFKQEQSRLEIMGKPFEFVSLDLAFVVSIFPLILGLILSASIIWATNHLQGLAWAVDEMVQTGGDRALLGWFSRRTGLSWESPRENIPGGKEWHRLGKRNKTWVLIQLIRILLYSVWMGIATWQLYGWEQRDTTQILWFLAAGDVLIIVAGLYSWLVARAITMLGVASPEHLTKRSKRSA